MSSLANLERETVKTRAHVYVSGRVQGVFFRARTIQKAVGLGATGWVRNLPDGRVEAVFEGEKEVVDALVEFCRKGPSRAVVKDVAVAWEPFTGEFESFSVRR
jgi:acylphosphatase